MKRRGVEIRDVELDGVAGRAGVRPSDRIVAIDGVPVEDIVDFHFLTSEEEFAVDLEDGEGKRRTVTIVRDYGAPLGMTLAPPVPRRCGNRCIFCFVHQLPSGLRPPLYVKDEDYRLSFLYGNYVTLSNLSQRDLERICRLHLSPLYVSVHATDQPTREMLLGRKERRPIAETLSILADAGISFHAQIVLLPGINDGEIFERTIHDLTSLAPATRSIAVVPVGLTDHRRDLPPITPVGSEYAASFLAGYEPLRLSINRRFGRGFLAFADEWYLRCDHPFPPVSHYGDFPQIENGVGMIPLFEREARRVIARARPLTHRCVTLVTGVSAGGTISRFAERLAAATGCSIGVAVVENRLFGRYVTVAGLVSGKDILETMRDIDPGDALIIPDVMLKEGEGLFLDDLTPDDLSRLLGVPVVVVPSTPAGVLAGLKRICRGGSAG